jgi:hypothetical protein
VKNTSPNFHVRASAHFNSFLDDLNLIKYTQSHRKFAWSNRRQFALLDRFICSLYWDRLYSYSVVTDLAKYDLDHCPLVLHIDMANLEPRSIFKCDASWFVYLNLMNL